MSRLLAGSALLGRSIRPLRPLRPSHSTRRLCGPPSAPPPPPSAATSAAAESAAPAGAAASGLAVAKEKIVGRLEWFMSCLHDYPLRTNAASTGVLCALGDALSQAVEWRLRISSPEKAEYNWQRTARMTFWGGCICGPVLSLWYRTLNTASEALVVSYQPVVSSGRLSWLLERTPMTGWLTALRREKELGVTSAQQLLGKVLADSVLFQAPFLNLYFAVTGLLEGLSPSATFEKTREAFHRSWAWSILICTPVQLVNLHFVPTLVQPLAVGSLLGLGWYSVLSLLSHYHEYGSPRRFEGGAEFEGISAHVAELEAENAALRSQLLRALRLLRLQDIQQSALVLQEQHAHRRQQQEALQQEALQQEALQQEAHEQQYGIAVPSRRQSGPR